jgi:hypothetical protein
VAVLHARGQQHAPGGLRRAVAELEHEAVLVAPAGHDGTGAELDGRVGAQLGAALGVQVRRRRLVVAEQAADPVRDAVALLAGVDDERAAAGAAEHERCAEACGPGADHDAVPGGVHAATVAADRRIDNSVCRPGNRVG